MEVPLRQRGGEDLLRSPARVKWEYAAYYIGLAAFLAVMTRDVHEMLGAARHLGGDT